MFRSRDLKNRVIVITGASSGIGAATAIACAQAGMDVVLAARRTDRLTGVAQQIQRLGRTGLPVTCDVDRDQDVAQLIEQTMDRFGRLDALFANAGVGWDAPILETTEAQTRALFETNFYGTLRCIRAAAPIMGQKTGKTDKGHILICSSCLSEIALPFNGVYSATKAAQDAVGGALRAELAPQGIGVTTVHPVTTQTEFFDHLHAHAHRSPRPQRIYNTFAQSPQHVARQIVRCLRRPRPEVWPFPPVRFAMALTTAFPRLSALAMKRIAKQ